MSGGGVKGPWNKWEGPTASCAVGGHPFMPRKPLVPTQRPTLRAAGGGLFYNPPPAASRRVRGLGQRPKESWRPGSDTVVARALFSTMVNQLNVHSLLTN